MGKVENELDLVVLVGMV